MDHEGFVKCWEKKRQKGKVKFIMSNILKYCVAYGIGVTVYNIYKGFELSKLLNGLPIFIAGFIGSAIGFSINWELNENKYFKALRKETLNSNLRNSKSHM